MHCIDELIEKYKVYIVADCIVYWLEIPVGNMRVAACKKQVLRQGIRLCSIPKELNEILYKELWRKPVPVILTSGTLSVNGSFYHIKNNMGIDKLYSDRLIQNRKLSPFNYEENCLLYISDKVPFPDNKDMNYIKAVANEIDRLINATHGHALVLFTSYRVMELVYCMLADRKLKYRIIKMNRGLLNPIDIFKQSNNSVLFASGNCWEGIDIPGDTLSSLIIVKLPFAVPDPISEYEQVMFDSFEEYKNKVVFPEMILKLRQGFGRLIRRETDTGVISILDSRLREGGNYRDRVLKALPHCPVTNSIKKVEQFIKQKKDENYFLTS
jgi:ATP-dependent DNA helicase DinG